MQSLFSVPQGWCDPLPGLRRSIVLILAVLSIESLAFTPVLRQLPVSRYAILGFFRAIDCALLLAWGPWSLRAPSTAKAAKDALLISVICGGGGLVFMMGWRGLFGASFVNLSDDIRGLSGFPWVIFFATSCILSPIAEELFFRGIVYRGMREKWNIWICAISVSLIFASAHLYFSGQAVLPFLGSMLFCMGYEKTRSVLGPIFLHMAGNLVLYLSPSIPFM